MTLANLTDPAAVHAAMAEYDSVGAEAFLKTYGFRRATGYLLVHEGREYDSKAIAGVAHGRQHPHLGTLKSSQFSGGDADTADRLRRLGFTVTKRRGGTVDWTKDELMLALDIYLQHGLLQKRAQQVVDLSELLGRLAAQTGLGAARNVTSVHFKLANFAAVDPASHGRGFEKGGRPTAHIWTQWSHRPQEVRRIATAIRSAVATGTPLPAVPHEVEDEEAVAEGATLYRLHRVRERSTRLRKKKLDEARAAGPLRCEACGVDPGVHYGVVADNVFDVHHNVPLATTGEVRVRTKDLAILCPTCHRVIHRLHGVTPFELRRIIETQRGVAAAP